MNIYKELSFAGEYDQFYQSEGGRAVDMAEKAVIRNHLTNLGTPQFHYAVYYDHNFKLLDEPSDRRTVQPAFIATIVQKRRNHADPHRYTCAINGALPITLRVENIQRMLSEMRGYLLGYTGNGKGKSTAAFGLALRAAGCEVVVTGRYAPEELIEVADLVTEMREMKHYYRQGIEAREGIEY